MGFILFDTCLGWMGILSSPNGLKQIILPQSSSERVLSHVGDFYRSTQDCEDNLLSDLPQKFGLYLAGTPVDFPSRLDLSEATCFQQSVWQIVRSVPYGESRSYAWIATQLGQSKAARAVGQALARNPLPIVIPCHRIVRSDGNIGDFSGGEKMKRYLLNMEADYMKKRRLPSRTRYHTV